MERGRFVLSASEIELANERALNAPSYHDMYHGAQNVADGCSLLMGVGPQTEYGAMIRGSLMEGREASLKEAKEICLSRLQERADWSRADIQDLIGSLMDKVVCLEVHEDQSEPNIEETLCLDFYKVGRGIGLISFLSAMLGVLYGPQEAVESHA